MSNERAPNAYSSMDVLLCFDMSMMLWKRKEEKKVTDRWAARWSRQTVLNECGSSHKSCDHRALDHHPLGTVRPLAPLSSLADRYSHLTRATVSLCLSCESPRRLFLLGVNSMRPRDADSKFFFASKENVQHSLSHSHIQTHTRAAGWEKKSDGAKVRLKAAVPFLVGFFIVASTLALLPFPWPRARTAAQSARVPAQMRACPLAKRTTLAVQMSTVESPIGKRSATAQLHSIEAESNALHERTRQTANNKPNPWGDARAHARHRRHLLLFSRKRARQRTNVDKAKVTAIRPKAQQVASRLARVYSRGEDAPSITAAWSARALCSDDGSASLKTEIMPFERNLDSRSRRTLGRAVGRARNPPPCPPLFLSFIFLFFFEQQNTRTKADPSSQRSLCYALGEGTGGGGCDHGGQSTWRFLWRELRRILDAHSPSVMPPAPRQITHKTIIITADNSHSSARCTFPFAPNRQQNKGHR